MDFEDLTAFTESGPTGSFYNGNLDGQSNDAGWSSHGVHFGNSYSSDFGGYWSGWSYSTVKDPNTGDFTNQYAALPGAGNRNSETYAVGFSGDALFFNVPENEQPQSVHVTNTTYTAATIASGNMFSKPFGGESGNDEDSFSVIFTGLDDANGLGEETGSLEYFLADYRSSDNSEDYRAETWEEVDLTKLGNARSVKLSFRSTDVGEFGINTPQYVAIDDLVFAPVKLLGDFDESGLLDVADIDALTFAVREPNPEPRFDLNADGVVNQADRTMWVHELKGTYFGDANLDGEFSSADLTRIFTFAEYEDSIEGNSTWERGDWNGNGDFETSDLILAFQDAGFEQGPRDVARLAVVPEPYGMSAFAIGLLLFGLRNRLS